MVQQAVQDGIGDGGFADDGVPVFDWALTGDDGGIFPIAVLDDFEQIVALGIVKRSEEQVVEDEQLDFGQTVKRFEMRAIGFGLEQGFKQARGAQIEHGVAVTGGEVAERTSDIAFAHAGGAGEQHVTAVGDPVLRGQLQDQLFV